MVFRLAQPARMVPEGDEGIQRQVLPVFAGSNRYRELCRVVSPAGTHQVEVAREPGRSCSEPTRQRPSPGKVASLESAFQAAVLKQSARSLVAAVLFGQIRPGDRYDEIGFLGGFGLCLPGLHIFQFHPGFAFTKGPELPKLLAPGACQLGFRSHELVGRVFRRRPRPQRSYSGVGWALRKRMKAAGVRCGSPPNGLSRA